MQHGDHGNAVLVASHIHLPLAVVTYQVINFVLNMHWVHCTRRPATPATNAPLYVERRMGRKLQNKNCNTHIHTQTNRNRWDASDSRTKRWTSSREICFLFLFTWEAGRIREDKLMTKNKNKTKKKTRRIQIEPCWMCTLKQLPPLTEPWWLRGCGFV